MKSFDQMADDFVQLHAERLAPYLLTKRSCALLRCGYMAGLAVGIEICTDTFKSIVKDEEEKGL